MMFLLIIQFFLGMYFLWIGTGFLVTPFSDEIECMIEDAAGEDMDLEFYLSASMYEWLEDPENKTSTNLELKKQIQILKEVYEKGEENEY